MFRRYLIFSIIMLFITGSAAGKDHDEPIIPDDDSCLVQDSAPYNFISFQEFHGRKNVTCNVWRMEVLNTKDIQTIDKNSTLKILFDWNKLADADLSDKGTIFTSGSLSLSARIGSRPIEVEGYSEVGKDRKPVGSSGKIPPYQFIFNMIQMQKSLYEVVGTYKNTFSEFKRGDALDPELQEPTAIMAKNTGISFMRECVSLNELLKLYLSDSATSVAFFKVLAISPTYITGRIKQLDLEIITAEKLIGSAALADENDRKPKEANKIYSKIQRLEDENYTNYNAIIMARDAYKSDPSNKDKQSILEKAKNEYNKINDELNDLKEEYTSVSGTQTARATGTAFMRIYPILQDLNNVLTKDVKISKLASEEKNISTTKPTTFNDQLSYSSLNINKDLKTFWEDVPLTSKNNMGRNRQIYQYLYENLTPGQIVLPNADAQPGDIVTVELLLYQNNDKPTSFTIGRFIVDDFGWNLNVVDSFLLVKELNRKSHKVNPNWSTSNFKGAAGASLLWSKNPRPGDQLEFIARNLSYGVNISYLDFDSTKDLEIGSGLIVGLFQNRVQTGIGFNLNTTGNLADRMYWFLGFSFGRIAEKFVKKDDVATQ